MIAMRMRRASLAAAVALALAALGGFARRGAPPMRTP